MEAAKLGCIRSPPPPCPSRSSSSSSRRGTSVYYAPKSFSMPTSSLSGDRPPSPSTLSPQLSLLSVVANFVCLPAWAAAEALESSSSSSLSSAAETVASASTQVSESAGASVESVAQSSAESTGAVASEAIVAAVGDSDQVINFLGAAAFVALSLLTVGVVYLVITDFLEKKKGDEETKKLNEEMAAAKKKQSSSLTAAGKGGAKGFGKKPRQGDE